MLASSVAFSFRTSFESEDGKYGKVCMYDGRCVTITEQALCIDEEVEVWEQ